MPNPVIHFEIQSTDAEKSQAFFEDVFGWEINSAPMPSMPDMNYAIVDTQSDSGIGGGIGPSFDDQSHVAFYIAVDDLQATLDKAVEAGGQVLMPVTVIPGAVTIAFFSDPTGAPVGLVANEMPQAE